MTPSPPLAAIEGGGTKFLVEVGEDPDHVAASARFETTAPAATLDQVIAFVRPHRVQRVGLGIFGPIELRSEPRFGSILRCPKPGWSGFGVHGYLETRLGVPVTVDTDVNAAAMAEQRWGAAQGCDPVVYVTIGTGIGFGVWIHGKPLHGLLHSELGHMFVPRLEVDGVVDSFPGACPFHGGCLEGMASGSAVQIRVGTAPKELDVAHPVFDLVGRYVAHGVLAATYGLSPERVVIGGGLGQNHRVLGAIRREVATLDAGYLSRSELNVGVTGFIVPARLSTRAGVAGAFALALTG